MMPMFLLVVEQFTAPAGHGDGFATWRSLMSSPVAASIVRMISSVEAVKTIWRPDWRVKTNGFA
jgi:hypothetical protein